MNIVLKQTRMAKTSFQFSLKISPLENIKRNSYFLLVRGNPFMKSQW